MRILILQFIYFSMFLGVFSPSFGRIQFYADFELRETYLLYAIQPGLDSIISPDSSIIIVLVKNGNLKDWPENGGVGIIEGNFPDHLEKFKYREKSGNVLKGVTGIQRNHSAWVDFRTPDRLK